MVQITDARTSAKADRLVLSDLLISEVKDDIWKPMVRMETPQSSRRASVGERQQRLESTKAHDKASLTSACVADEVRKVTL